MYWGRRTKIKDPLGYETTFAYDSAYRLTSETNADDSYDSLDRLIAATHPNQTNESHTSDDVSIADDGDVEVFMTLEHCQSLIAAINKALVQASR